LWVYRELLFELRPDLIVETGTTDGGSALYLASICDLLGRRRVITIDVLADEHPAHPRAKYLVGSSTDPVIVDVVRREAASAGTVFVVLDANHTEAHVLDELRAYAPSSRTRAMSSSRTRTSTAIPCCRSSARDSLRPWTIS
jgi:cephalosporin hydroxylase